MPLQQTSGAASYDAFGGGAPVAAKYIEDFFQTWLRTGTGSSTTVTTGLNASINETMVWTKSRSAATNHKLTDNVRGATKALSSNATVAEVTDSQGLTAFSSTGYTIGTNTDYNNSGATYVDWQWVATPKFFDVVTYTGDGTSNRQIAHNLGSAPGCVIIKKTNDTGDWTTWHTALPTVSGFSQYQSGMQLNTTAANDANGYLSAAPTSTYVQIGTNRNGSGDTFVMYLFAHNAGGFGLTGTDNVISCGSYTANGNNTIELGYEPQWILFRRTNTADNWEIYDTMRGLSLTGSQVLNANSSAAEGVGGTTYPTATGFYNSSFGSGNIIYIAIRRGPMKVPTDGTEVFAINTRNGSGTAPPMYNSGYPIDMAFQREVTTSNDSLLASRLTSGSFMRTSTTAAETSSAAFDFDYSNGWYNGTETNPNAYSWMFTRAPNFMDSVCWTGDGTVSRNQVHNLGVKPELTIVKKRSNTASWGAVCILPGSTSQVILNSNAASPALISGVCFGISATLFVVGDEGSGVADVNATGETYVAYFFATCPGVSKVGTYTGTATTQQINCGFTSGARFVMIKRTDDTGDWYMWDSARGIVAGNDPYILINSSAAQVTSTDYVDTYSAGFELTSTAPAAINASGGSYLFLAIA